MTTIFEDARHLNKTHEGSFIRLDRDRGVLDTPPTKRQCYRLHRVWSDGINIRKYGSDIHVRPSFISLSKLRQRVQVFTVEEFENLPE